MKTCSLLQSDENFAFKKTWLFKTFVNIVRFARCELLLQKSKTKLLFDGFENVKFFKFVIRVYCI